MIDGVILSEALTSDFEHVSPYRKGTVESSHPPVFLVGQRNLALEGLRTLLLKNDIQVDDVATSVRDLNLPSSLDTRRLLVIFDVTEEIGVRREEIASLRLRCPNACIIVLLSHFKKNVTSLPSEFRVNAILDRNIACEALMKTLHVALAGYAVLSSVTSGEPIETSVPKHGEPAKPSGLSEREAEIIGCIAEGQSNKVIARRFSISEATVKIHVRGILRKVDARNRTQAAVWALQKGFGTRTSPLID